MHYKNTPSPTPPAKTDITITGTVYPTNPYDPSASSIDQFKNCGRCNNL
ncbi:MAG: hypothetical protein IPL10_05375 [Bacteroidetes bacterium]|nr:hypothetical protein [Bacteroidota bacterium]